MRRIQTLLAGGASLLAMVGIVYFLAQAAVITCPIVPFSVCTGTDANDTITIISGDDQTVFGRAGDDVILDSGAPGPDESHLIFGGHGNDDIRTLNTCTSGGSWTIFGEYGDDSINISTLTCNADHHVDGGPGNDTLRHTPTIGNGTARVTFVDGRGRDVIIIGPSGTDGGYVVYLVGDNEQDTVRINEPDTPWDAPVVISLHRDSGRDVIVCPAEVADPGDWDITIFLNGNYKAVDQLGNNLRQAALLGGGTPGCPAPNVTIIP